MLDSAYLRDLGGLSDHRGLAVLDLRGTGASDVPADPTSYRCDRQVADVEAVRRHLGVERIAVLGHSAGAGLAFRYVERHPDRVSRLLLVTPSTRALGLSVGDEARSAVALTRAAEPWYPEAAAALTRAQAGTADEADWTTTAPFAFGRWDEETIAYREWMEEHRLDEQAGIFNGEGAFDPTATTLALRRLDVPVLILAGGVDLSNPPTVMADVAALFPHCELVVQDGAGHFPWVDDPATFVALVRAFVAESRTSGPSDEDSPGDQLALGSSKRAARSGEADITTAAAPRPC